MRIYSSFPSSDGCSVGLTLEGASKEEISELDRLLTVMADMRSPVAGVEEREREGVRERVKEGVREGVRERGKEGVRERVKEGVRKEEREDEKPTWGTTIAGVSSDTVYTLTYCPQA